jgi:hypothetical protein
MNTTLSTGNFKSFSRVVLHGPIKREGLWEKRKGRKREDREEWKGKWKKQNRKK